MKQSENYGISIMESIVKPTAHKWLLLIVLSAAVVSVQAQNFALRGYTSELTQVLALADGDGNSTPEPSSSPTAQDARDKVFYPGDTERPKALARKLVINILLDQKQIWTSPFHMHGNDAWWWIGFGGATAALIATDHRTSTLLENSRGQVRWANNLSNIGSTYTLIPLVAGFYGFGVFTNDPKAREVGVLGAEAMLDSLIVVSVLKPIAGRNRPNSGNDNGSFFDGGSGFPSGHSIEVWSLASVISYEYGHTKVVPIVAVALAGVVSASRFAARQHFASDIVAGGAMGWFIGRYVWKTHQDHAIHAHSPLKAHFMPQFQPSTRTYAMTVSIGRN
jgi:membrane-associated phospholipid phosphatase